MTTTYPKGRAYTDELKREIIEQVYEEWCNNPHLRLGQLISIAARGDGYSEHSIFNIEDEELVDKIRDFRQNVMKQALE